MKELTTKKCRVAGDPDLPLQKKRSGGARKTSERTLKVLKHQVDLEPHISTKDPEKWKTVLWSDEATFTVTGNREGKVMLGPGSNPHGPLVHPGDCQTS